MFTAEISSYEDHQDISTGHAYTIYNISVEAKSLNKKWVITKRYKHFQYLYATLKTEYPHNAELNAMHFPRKSMFHTFSDQTKAKRKSNFDDFIKIALQLYPMPLCVEDFLDIIDRCGRSYSHSAMHSNTPPDANDRPLPYTYTSPAKTERLHNRNRNHVHYSTSECGKDHVTAGQDSSASVSDILNNKDEKRKMTYVLYSTFLITTLVYVICILIGIIDIQGTTFGRLLLTAVSLGSTASLLRISLIKRDVRKRQAFIREFKTALKAC